MSPPSAISGEASWKNGPNTVDAVARGDDGALIPTVSIDNPKNVREQNELLTAGVGDVPGAGEEPDAGLPLVLRQRDVAGESVQVPGEARHHLAQPLVHRVVEARHHLVGDSLLPATYDGPRLVLPCVMCLYSFRGPGGAHEPPQCPVADGYGIVLRHRRLGEVRGPVEPVLGQSEPAQSPGHP